LEESKDSNVEQITGFEEFYAEPPMSPDEAEEEEQMYDAKLSVATYVSPCPTVQFRFCLVVLDT